MPALTDIAHLILKPAACSRRSGSALVLVLVLTSVLALLVGAMSFEARLELQYANFIRNRRQCEALADSGVAIANLLMAKQVGLNAESEPEDDGDRWFDAAKRLALGQPIQGLVEPIGEGEVIIDIVPEPARRNVNLLGEDDWECILTNAGVPEDYHPMIIDSVLDWIDEDDSERDDGAESDYYKDLDPDKHGRDPYSAKNGPLDTVQELLLVRGFCQAILSGGELDEAEMDPIQAKNRFNRKSRFDKGSENYAFKGRGASGGTNDVSAATVTGIEHMLTTYGDGKVNIQSAPREVLLTIPEIAEEEDLVDAIIEERGDLDTPEDIRKGNNVHEPFSSVDDVFARISNLPASLRDKITVNSAYYRVTVVGRVGLVQRKVWAIVFFDGKTPRYLRWCEDN